MATTLPGLPTSVSSLTSLTTTAAGLSNLILVVPQIAGIFGLGANARTTQGYAPQNPPQSSGLPQLLNQNPPAILFHYEGEQTALIESDITDHYVEDNTAIQDQIALKPEVITTHGFIGELNDVPPAALQALRAVANNLTLLSSYTPGLSVTAQLAYADAFQTYQSAQVLANNATSAWNTLSGQSGENVIGPNGLVNPTASQSLQQTYFQQFYGYWRSRTLFTVQTPWAVFQNMAIKSLRAIQSAETNTITDFEVSFKMIRTVLSQSTSAQTILSGRAGNAAAPVNNLGVSTPPSSISTSTAMSNSGLTI